jgi:hypothetical protein
MRALAAQAVAVCGPLARVQMAYGVWSLSPHPPTEKKKICFPFPISSPSPLTPSPPSRSPTATSDIPPWTTNRLERRRGFRRPVRAAVQDELGRLSSLPFSQMGSRTGGNTVPLNTPLHPRSAPSSLPGHCSTSQGGHRRGWQCGGGDGALLSSRGSMVMGWAEVVGAPSQMHLPLDASLSPWRAFLSVYHAPTTRTWTRSVSWRSRAHSFV